LDKTYTLYFDDKATKDLKTIDKIWQLRILDKIESTLITHPKSGKKLVGNLSSYWRLRVGNYRIIYKIVDNTVTVVVLKIKHRKDIY